MLNPRIGPIGSAVINDPLCLDCPIYSDTDPGAIGAGLCWFDTSGTGVLYKRNDSNTAWIPQTCGANNGTTYAKTPGGTLPKPTGPVNIGGNWTWTGSLNIAYWRAGGSGIEYPLAGVVGDWGNGGTNNCVFSAGGVDYGGGGSAIYFSIAVVGPGTLTINLVPNLGLCARGGTIDVYAARSGTGFVVDSASVAPGVPINLVIPNDGFCAHYASVGNTTSAAWGFQSAIWTPNLA